MPRRGRDVATGRRRHRAAPPAPRPACRAGCRVPAAGARLPHPPRSRESQGAASPRAESSRAASGRGCGLSGRGSHHRREQGARARDQRRYVAVIAEQVEVDPQRLQVEPQFALVHTHPHREPFVNAVRHFGSARLGEGDAQDRLGRYAVEHQPQHARRQHLRLARAGRRAQPDMADGIGGGALVRIERRKGRGAGHAPSSPRPNHSSRRINWS